VTDSSVRFSRSLNLQYLSFSRSLSSLPSFSLYIYHSCILNFPFHVFWNFFYLPLPPLFSAWSRAREPIAPQIRGSTVTAIIGHSSSSRVYIYIFIFLLNIFIYIYIYLFHIIVISSRVLLRFFLFIYLEKYVELSRSPAGGREG